MSQLDHTVLDYMTSNIMFRMHEKENLKKLAKKITKVPDSSHIPSEYLIEKERVE